MISQVVLHGRLAHSPELKHTQNGVAVCSFTVANETGLGENKRVHFIDCVAWRGTAEFICKYFRQGQGVVVAGRLQARTWEDREGGRRKAVEVVVEQADFCGPKGGQAAPPLPEGGPQPGGMLEDGGGDSPLLYDDGDIPF